MPNHADNQFEYSPDIRAINGNAYQSYSKRIRAEKGRFGIWLPLPDPTSQCKIDRFIVSVIDANDIRYIHLAVASALDRFNAVYVPPHKITQRTFDEIVITPP
jgi:hypothetical protein